MKTRIITLLLVGGGIIFFFSSCTKRYEESTFRILGEVYTYALPLANQSVLQNYVESNKYQFKKDGEIIQAAKVLGEKLLKKSYESYDRNSNYYYERALDMGANLDQARQIENDVNSGALDLYTIGQELLWLAEVLPEAAQGNWSAYNNTGTEMRKQVRQILPLLQTLSQFDDPFGPSMSDIVQNAVNMSKTFSEDYLVYLAAASGLLK